MSAPDASHFTRVQHLCGKNRNHRYCLVHVELYICTFHLRHSMLSVLEVYSLSMSRLLFGSEIFRIYQKTGYISAVVCPVVNVL